MTIHFSATVLPNGLFENPVFYEVNDDTNYVITKYDLGESTLCRLWSTDFLSLSGESWLTGDVIDMVLKLKIFPYKEWLLIDHNHTQSIFGGEGITGENAPNFQTLNANFAGVTHIIMPWVDNGHWRLVIANMITKEFVLLDPRGPPRRQPKVVNITNLKNKFRNFMKLVDERLGNESALSQGWTIGQIKIELPRQKDGFNCGIYILMFFDIIFLTTPKNELGRWKPDSCRTIYQKILLQKSVNMQNACQNCGATESQQRICAVVCKTCKRKVCTYCQKSRAMAKLDTCFLCL
jgi:hypothetical protein